MKTDEEKGETPVIKVAALTSGKNVPSRRFRVQQYIKKLSSAGITVNEYVPIISKWARLWGWPKNVSQAYIAPLWLLWLGIKLSCRLPGILNSWTHDITWLQRQMLPGFPTFEFLLKKPLVFDVDDAIWLWPPWGAKVTRMITRRADVIIAGNQFLADWLSDYNQDVRIVPTALDTNKFCPSVKQKNDGKSTFTIGWTGHSSNFRFLKIIEKPLSHFLNEYPDTRFLIVADKPPRFSTLNEERMDFVYWNVINEAKTVQTMDVGIMPLKDTSLARGKCSLKMLQYMACGLPVIVSPVGMNVEVLAKGEIGVAAEKISDWYDALKMLYLDREKAKKFGRCGRRVVENDYCSSVIARDLGKIFREVYQKNS